MNREPIMHAYPIAIKEEAIDEHGHVNNAIYLTWVQAAITDFWDSTAPQEIAEAVIWLARRHDISYLSPVLLNDDITAKVIATGYSGAQAHFLTIINRHESAVAKISTTLVCLDKHSHRLLRVRDNLADLFFHN